MIRSKEDLIKALKVCQSATCDECPYADIGCSPPLAYDALELIEQQENMIIYMQNVLTSLRDRLDHVQARLRKPIIIDPIPPKED